jgi:hypothetical protein
MRRLSPEELARAKRLEQLEKELKKIFSQSFYLSLRLPEIMRAFRDGDEKFSIAGNRAIIKKINRILNKQYSQFNISLINGIKNEFEITNSDLWHRLKNRFGNSTAKAKEFEMIKEIATKGVRSIAEQSRNFINQKRNGLTVSERVWKSFEGVTKEIDVIVQNGIKEGKSADTIARELPEYLQDEKKLFRRVRNKKTGKLEWSKAAKDYHPGQGKYRSSYKNAMRLTRTEINTAYRLAEWNGYQNNPLITGFEIALSNNTENQCDVCKRLAGFYPKWFKWSGWHPQCRCRMIATLITMQERQQLAILTLQGKRNEFKAKEITELPTAFKEYLSESRERIANASSLPYWYSDNIDKLITL